MTPAYHVQNTSVTWSFSLDVTDVIDHATLFVLLFSCVGVDVNLQLQPASPAVARIESAEQLSMQQLLEEYAANTGMAQDVLELARGALKVQL
jgi:hypothetical protein